MKTSPLFLGFGLHNHQPVGNFDSIFEQAYQQAYQPFLEVLERHPGISISQHFTGILLEWFEKHHPDFIERLGRLIEKGQIELIGGGYYEPILAMLPQRDSQGQIEALNQKIQSRFGRRPRGAWVAERVWEPSLASLLADCGIEYVVLDDAHFKMAGLRQEQLTGPFVTEDQGKKLTVFPISQKLRYTIPFQPVKETLDYLRKFPQGRGPRCVVMADDGEKFGIWPETFHSVYEEGWLEDFFTALEKESEWLHCVSIGSLLDATVSEGLVYLPTASYSEMMDWVLPWNEGRAIEDFRGCLDSGLLKKYGRFIKGGFWRSFFVKYRETQQMHRKMLSVSEKVHQIPDLSDIKVEALRHLWAGQCNCGYWHGIFGGIYLNHIRAENYHNLIEAEKYADQALNLHPVRHWKEDFFRDGGECLLVRTPSSQLTFDLSNGAELAAWDWLPSSWNLINTITRRQETYHRHLLKPVDDETSDGHSASIHDLHRVKEKGLEKWLVYDPYRRVGNISHLFSERLSLESFQKNPAVPTRAGFDFLSLEADKKFEQAPAVTFTLFSQGLEGLNHPDGGYELKQVWKYNTESDDWTITCGLTNRSRNHWHGYYGIEFGWSLNAGNTYDRYYRIDGEKPEDPNLGSTGESHDVREVSLYEDWWRIQISLSFSWPARLWRFPIETVSSSEGGFERTYQSSVVIPAWKVDLAAGKSWSTTITLAIRDTSKGGHP